MLNEIKNNVKDHNDYVDVYVYVDVAVAVAIAGAIAFAAHVYVQINVVSNIDDEYRSPSQTS